MYSGPQIRMLKLKNALRYTISQPKHMLCALKRI